jgi:outer membrane murein-binding lipoprotein Lpp
LTGLIIGGGVYYLTSRAAQSHEEELDSQISQLQSQLEQLQSQNEQLQSSQQSTSTEDSTTIEGEAYNHLTLKQIKNTKYTIYGQAVNDSYSFTLEDGIHSYNCSGQKCTINVFTNQLTGKTFYDIADVAGDSSKDAVVILGRNSGGTGTWKYLAVLTNKNGQPSFTDSIMIGDDNTRGDAGIVDLAVSNKIIRLDVKDYAKNDPNCCPSVDKTFFYKIENGKILEK